MEKIIFFNIGWMEHYQGISDNDRIQGGGEFVHQNNVGAEIFNFKEYQGKVYGFVETKVTDNRDGKAYMPNGSLASGKQRRKICIDKLGASERDESIDKVDVIWAAPSPSGNTYIVGWYRHATVFRKHQKPETLTYRTYNGMVCDYNVFADFKDAVLLPVDKRTFKIPRGENGMGQSNVWYGNEETIKRVRDYISREGRK